MPNQERIQHILELSKKIGTDSSKIISLMQEHITEIKELFNNKDEHYAIETGDLIILAYQLLMMEGKDPEKVLEKCYPRYDKKFKNG